MSALKKSAIKRVKGNGRGYMIDKKEGLKRVTMFFTPDVVELIDDFKYEMLKKHRLRVTASGLTRAAVRAYMDLPLREQISRLEE